MAPHHILIRRSLGAAIPLGFVFGIIAADSPAGAQSTLPSGGHVVAGSATISAPNGNALTINQNSSRAVVNWNSFSVGQPNTVDFVQPSSSAAILNRVTGGTPSTIAGQIDANGQVYLVNPNGIAITPSGSVQVGGGFVASTLGIATGDFMAGTLAFTGNGASAGVSNAGSIAVGAGGYAALLGGTAANSGVISVPLGRVALGSGEQATLDLNGDGFMQVAAPTGTTTAKGQALVGNSGRIDAAGGTVELRAATVATAIRNAVNMSGVVAANSVSGHDGAITLSGGPGGAVNVTGTLDASARTAWAAPLGGAPGGGSGGSIAVDGARVRVGHRAVLNTSGATGGSVLVGVSAPGGVNEAARTTIASGAQILANGSAAVAGSGGYIETSGGTLKLGGAVISAGRGGTWLTDPDNLTIDATAATTIDAALAAGTNVTEMTTATGFSGTGNVSSGAGDIDVVSALSWNTAATLTLSAFNNIIVSAPITPPTTPGIGGALVLTYNNAGVIPGATLGFVPGQGSATFTQAANSQLFINNGAPSGNGTQYTLVYTETAFDAMASGGNYALAGPLAFATAYTHTPIVEFSGNFNGLGNTISGFNITTSDVNVGLFGQLDSGATITNVALSGASVVATNSSANVGGLLGFSNSGTVAYALTAGTVSDGNITGGLVGNNVGVISNSASSANVGGGNTEGGLIGVNGSLVSNSYATGTVSGSGLQSAGGLMGVNGGMATNVAALGAVTASAGLVGGLVADNSGQITDAYETGHLTGGGGVTNIGGLVGFNGGSITLGYWDTTTNPSLNAMTGGIGANFGSGTATGTTTAALATGLPAGFSPSVWGNVNNQTTPYLLTNPSPVVLSNNTEGFNPAFATLIFTPTQLNAIRGNLSGLYALAQDIDLSTFGNFTPIGSSATPFMGTLNGLGNVVSNITINDTTDADVGLIGQSNGAVINIGLIGGTVTGGTSMMNTGGLVGLNFGSITNVYSTATVSAGQNMNIGGLIGLNEGFVNDAYATGTVTGGNGSSTGGLIGQNTSGTTVTNTYAIATVTGNAGVTGGLVGQNAGTFTDAYSGGTASGGTDNGALAGLNAPSGHINNGYWNADRGGATGIGSQLGVLSGGGPLAASGASPFTAASYTGFTFTTTPGAANNNWVIVDANGSLNNAGGAAGATMPMLALEAQSIVQNAHQLQLMAMNLGGSYTLGRSVDATTTGSSTSASTGADVWTSIGFIPVGGNGISGFVGTFNGLNATTGLSNTISNLTINTSQFYAGLFGQTDGTIENVGLVGGSVTSSNAGSGNGVGSLAGYQGGGTIFQTYATMPVTGHGAGDLDVGGLVGFQGAGTISQSFATGTVNLTSPFISTAGGLVGTSSGTITLSFASGAVTGTSDAETGGLVGFAGGSITDSYATGAVRATSNGVAGGLAGVSSGSITDTYATGAVSGGGGLTGNFFGGTIIDSYWDTQTTGQASSASGTPMTTAQLQSLNLSSAFANPSNWGILTGPTKSYPYLCWQVANCLRTPQVVSGTVYQDFGATPAGSGITVSGLVNANPLNSMLTGGAVTTGANGYYYYLLAPNTLAPFQYVLTYAQNFPALPIPANGATLWTGGTSQSGLDIYANTLHEITTETAYSAVVSDLDTATGGTGTAVGSLVSALPHLQIDAAGAFQVDAPIAPTGGLIINVGTTASSPVALTQTGAGTITVTDNFATFNNKSTGGTITLTNAGNNITFSVGVPPAQVAISTTGTGATASLTDSATLALGAVTVGGNLTLTGAGIDLVGNISAGSNTVSLISSGSITQFVSSITAGALTGSSSGGATFTGSANNQIPVFGPFINTGSGGISLFDSSATLALSGAITASGQAVGFTAGGLTETISQGSGSVITAGALQGNYTGTLNGNNLVGTLDWQTNGGGNFSFTNAQALTVTGAATLGTTGTLTLTTTGAGNGITVNGIVSASSTVINSAGALTVNSGGTIGGTTIDLTATSIALNGTATLGPGAIDLAHGGAIGNITEASTAEISGSLNATNTITGTVNLAGANNAITTLHTMNLTTAGDSFVLTDKSPLTIFGPLHTTNAAISVTTSGSTAFGITVAGSINAGSGTVTLTSAGKIADTAGAITAGTLTGSSVGGANFTGANLIHTFGPWTDTGSGSTGINLGDTEALVTAGAISSRGPVVLATTSGNLTIGNDALSTISGTSFTATAGSGAQIILSSSTSGSTVTTSGGGQTYNSPIVLGAITLLTDTGNGPITFDATVDAAIAGGESLTVNDGTGVATFKGAVGSIAPLASLAVTDPVIDANMTTVGVQSYNGAVTLGNANGTTVTLATGGAAGANIGLNSTVDGTTAGQQGLIVNAGALGNVTFGGVVGGTVPLLSLAATGDAISLGGAVTTSGALSLAATGSALTIPVALNAGGTATLAAGGAITEPAGGSITAANLVATTQLDGGAPIALNQVGADNIRGAVTLTSLNSAGRALAGGAISFTDSTGFTITSQGGLQSGIATSGAATAIASAGNLTIAAGAAATGDGVVLSTTGSFINNEGADAVAATGGGRWLIYSSAPAGDNFGNLNSNDTAIWGATFATLPPASVTAGGDRYVFAQTQTLTVTTTNLSKTYGQDATAAVAAAFTESGFASGVANAFLADTAANVVSGTPSVTSVGAATIAVVAGSPYAIAATAGTLTVGSGYSLAFANTGVLTVIPAALTVTASDQSKTYGQVASLGTTAFTTSGLLNSDSVSGVTLASTGAAATATVAGSPYAIVASNATGSGLSNYTISYVNGALNVTPAALMVTASNQSKVYGQTASLGTTAFTTSGLLNSDSVSGVTLTSTGVAATANVAGSPYAIVASNAVGTGLSNYTISYVNGALSVTPAALMVTASNQSKIYGQTLSLGTTAFTTSGLVNSDSVSGVTLTSTGVAATANVAGSPYAIVASNAAGSGLSNYTISYVNGALSVTPAALTVTASNQSKIYGQVASLGTTAFTTSGLVNSDSVSAVTLTSLGVAATANVAGSPYAITASNAVGTGLSNYTISYVNGALGVTPAALMVTASNQSKTYGQVASLGTTAFTTSGLVNSDSVSGVTLTSTGVAATANVAGSPYAIVASNAAGSGLSNYTISYVNGALSVIPAALTVTASNQSKTYGQTLSLGTTAFTTSGLVNSDSVSGVTLTSTGTAATAIVAGSPYAIVASNATGSGLSNYTISYVNGALGVTPATLTVTASNQSKTYGQVASLGTTAFTTSGLLNSDSVSGVTLASTGAAATATVAGSPYAIVASNAAGSGLSNYTISYVNGALSVTPAALTVTASNQSKIYGQVASLGTTAFTTSGLLNSDSVSGVTLTSAGAAATADVAGSPYAIVASNAVGGGLGNYTISYVNGALSVTPAALTATITGNPTKIYDGTTTAALASGNFTLFGFVTGQGATVSALTGAYASPNAATGIVVNANLVAGDFTATGTTNFANYTLPTAASGTGTITPAPLIASIAGNPTKVYDGTTTAALASGNFTLSGFVGNQGATVSALSGAYATANVGSNIGVSANLVSGDFTANGGTLLSNYTLPTTASGTGAITPAALTIAADNLTKVYGNSLGFAGTEFTVSGLVANDAVTGVSLASTGAAATAGVAGSPYAITASAATGTGLANYAINYLSGNLTVMPRPITVTADDLSRGFSQPNPPLTFAVTAGNLVNGDALSGALATTAANGSRSGPYPITQGTLGATPNYLLTFVGGTLVVMAVPDFGVSPVKYIPPVSVFVLPLLGATQCSPTSVASTLKNSGIVIIFGNQASACGSL